MRTAGAEHLVDQTLGSDVLDFGQEGGFHLLASEAFADRVVDECHDAGRDDDAGDRVSEEIHGACSECGNLL